MSTVGEDLTHSLREEIVFLKHPSHPGRVLKNEFLAPLSMTPYKLALLLHVPRTRIERLVACKTAMTPDTALRLAKFFGTSAKFWLNMQTNFDVATAVREVDVSDIEPIVMAG